MSKRFHPYAIFLLGLAGAAAPGQTLSTIRILTEPAGADFYVDGQRYSGAATFLWPVHSKHQLAIPDVQLSTTIKARYSFQRWTDSTGNLSIASPVIWITADPAITQIKAEVREEYALSLLFNACDPAECGSPGTVHVGGIAYASDAQIYLEPGARVSLQAFPNQGWVFVGWLQGMGSPVQAFVNSVVMDRPKAVYPRFERASRMTLETSPPGLRLLADRTPVMAPATLEWGVRTTHSVGVVSPQVDSRSKVWVFESWSDGGAAVHAYSVPEDPVSRTLTARFVPAAAVTFLTSPPGLKLTVDGRENWQSYNFNWAPGSIHTVAAPEHQVDGLGRTCVFRSWSNGGPALQELSVPEEAATTGWRLTAVYEPLGRVTVRTAPPGIAIEVDGAECLTPCTVERTVGAALRLRVPEAAPGGEGVRLDFEGWADGAGQEREITVPAEPVEIGAAYRVRYRLLTTSDPDGAAQWEVQPASGDGYYDAGQAVAFQMEPQPGYRFRHWEGDFAGAARSGLMSMNGPKHVRAVFEKVAYVPPGGVQNAAGPTPNEAVAPGSVIAVTGVNLAPWEERGPDSPLAQTLAGVWLQIDDRILPLFSVSGERVNALLPADVAEGPQTLVLKQTGRSDLRIPFRVERNAPGLFHSDVEGVAFAAAAHESGEAVTLESPARPGEVVTLFGTGLGPYRRRPVEGFAVPAAPEFPLEDTVEIVAGEAVIAPLFAGAAPGQVGVQAIRFRAGEDWPEGGIEVRLRVNGRESNTVRVAGRRPVVSGIE